MAAIVVGDGKLYGLRRNGEIFIRPTDHRRFGDPMERAWTKHRLDDRPIPTHIATALQREPGGEEVPSNLLHW